MLFRQIFDPSLAQYAYLIGSPATGEALVIDPERDVDRYLEAARKADLEITAVAETHIHADFLSGARELASATGARVYLSAEGGEDWSYRWGSDEEFEVILLRGGDSFQVGKIEVRALHTPGHTPEHLAYLVVDRGGGADEPMGLVSGDFAFVGDLGRPDLLEQAAGQVGVQEESARQLFRSIPALLQLEDYVQLWPGHGAGTACGKALGAVPTSTVGYERRHNATLAAAGRGEDEFVEEILTGQPEPPLYFARMKTLNRDGPALLGRLPSPPELGVDELGELSKEVEGAHESDTPLVLDTRTNPSEYMERHLPGSLYGPLRGSFSTRVGSVVVDPERPLLLVVDGDRVEEAVRDLIRIGFDAFAGYVTPETLDEYFEGGGPSESIAEVGFDEVDELREEEGTVVLDVRYAFEYEAGHVPGAANASYTRLPVLYEERVPEEGRLVVHCSSGIRSAVAAAWLKARGRDVVYVGAPWSDWTGSHPTEDPADAGAEVTA